MPRKPIDYSKTIMYKLCCKDPEITDIYIGHTTDFSNRKRQHKCITNAKNIYSKGYDWKIYQTIRKTGGWENWSMIEVENYNCNSRREAEAREQYWIIELNATLNSQYACGNNDKNRSEYMTKYMKAYQEKNRENLKQYNSDYHKKKNELNSIFKMD